MGKSEWEKGKEKRKKGNDKLYQVDLDRRRSRGDGDG